ncbi:MarR family winged helix-turn-helix transcriptional regulator [Leifsonia shinshuensis]|uniref:DNA-binding MarR family transcriptional regulator n=1 Tax=Leifsonia shinshuensis TaxID=150026 RepID=A0A853CUI7_9MICO|nr:MarR family transcriptional regulator [Leifsonia shinshuensis]NYJ22864.1 DNA-binding MarR family transcriptional regulator [Leifsonia shinshuensis]
MPEQNIHGPRDFGDRLTYLVRRIDGALAQRLDQRLRDYGLTPAQLSALAQLDIEHPGTLTGAQLADRSGVTAQSMSAAIARLLERGLVHRTQSTVHGRRLDVSLTPAGAELLRTVQHDTLDAEAAVDFGLDDAELDRLKQTLRRVARALGVFLPAEQGDPAAPPQR